MRLFTFFTALLRQCILKITVLLFNYLFELIYVGSKASKVGSRVENWCVLCLDQVYYVYGFMLLVFLILVIVTVCVTIVGTYFLLNAENYHWQWTSFLSAASTSLWVLQLLMPCRDSPFAVSKVWAICFTDWLKSTWRVVDIRNRDNCNHGAAKLYGSMIETSFVSAAGMLGSTAYTTSSRRQRWLASSRHHFILGTQQCSV